MPDGAGVAEVVGDRQCHVVLKGVLESLDHASGVLVTHGPQEVEVALSGPLLSTHK